MVKFLTNNNFFILAIISIPFLSFANSYFDNFNIILFRSIFLIFSFVVLSIFLLGIFLSLFSKKLNYKTISFILSFIFFVFFYFYTPSKNLLWYIEPIYNGEITFALLIIFLILFLVFFFIRKYDFFKYFILIYLSLCFIANISIFFINISIFELQKMPTGSTLIDHKKAIEYLNKNKKKICI